MCIYALQASLLARKTGDAASAEAAAASATLTDEERNVAEALAYGCIRYADLSRSRLSDYKFSYTEMLKDKGNTAVYMLYMYARISAILRRPEVAAVDVAAAAASTTVAVSLAEDKERGLAAALARFPEMVERVLAELLPHFVCEYVYELASVFSEFYDNCKVVDNGVVNVSRVLLIEATRQVFLRCFKILGLRPLERI